MFWRKEKITPAEHAALAAQLRFHEKIALIAGDQFRDFFDGLPPSGPLLLARPGDLKPGAVTAGKIVPLAAYPVIRKAIEVERGKILQSVRRDLARLQRSPAIPVTYEETP